MEGALLSTQSNNTFRTHLKNAATVLCARAFPKSKCSEQPASSSKHHTYPRATPPKRASISCRMEPLVCDVPQATTFKQAEAIQCEGIPPTLTASKTNGVVKFKSALAR